MKLENINTKRGDDGETDLYYGGRIKKSSWQVKLGGQISLFNAAIGRCHKYLKIDHEYDLNILTVLSEVQSQLVVLMGEIYTSSDKHQKYYKNHKGVCDEDVAVLDDLISDFGRMLDREGYKIKGWVQYGMDGEAAAEFDFCAELCRTIEPIVYEAIDSGASIRKEICIYINRLSKLFYIMGRVKAFTDNERNN